jgi:hypothetical protein
VHCATRAVAIEGARVVGSGFLGAGERLRLRTCARGGKERAVRLLGRMGEAALQPAQQHDRPAFPDRKAVTPQPHRESEPEIGDEQRIRPLARQCRRRPGNADAKRVELTVERNPAQLDAPEESFGMGDRRRAGECSGNRPLER